jgi:choline monooxygenase
MPPDHCRHEPLEEAHALHASFYSDPRWLDVEQRGVFGASWQLAAHAGDLSEPGDHMPTEVAGKPVLIVRQPGGDLKAFYNVCRHRAGPLAVCNGKGARALHCKYHGWTYELDGRLRAATEMQDATAFDAGGLRLPEIPVREWQGLVFVVLDEEALRQAGHLPHRLQLEGLRRQFPRRLSPALRSSRPVESTRLPRLRNRAAGLVLTAALALAQ